MIKAFLYDNVTGEVHQGLLTGVDCLGNGQWMNITRDEEPYSITHVIYGNDTHSLRILSTDDKPISSKLLAKVLTCKINTYEKIYPSLRRFIYKMKDIGIEWNKESLPLEFDIFQDDKDVFGFNLQTLGPKHEYLESVTGLDNVNELLEYIRIYIDILENIAEIPVSYKRLQIKREIKKTIKKPYLKMFDEVEVRKD